MFARRVAADSKRRYAETLPIRSAVMPKRCRIDRAGCRRVGEPSRSFGGVEERSPPAFWGRCQRRVEGADVPPTVGLSLLRRALFDGLRDRCLERGRVDRLRDPGVDEAPLGDLLVDEGVGVAGQQDADRLRLPLRRDLEELEAR